MAGRHLTGQRGRAVAAAAALIVLVRLFLPPSAPAFDPNTGDLSKEESTDIRVMTYNTMRNFIWDSGTDGEYERLLQALDPDIIVFEEIYWQVTIDQIEGRLDSLLGGTWTAWTGKYSSFYVGGDWVLDVCNAVASRWPLSMERWDTSPNASTRGVTMALIDLPDATYRRDFYIMGNHFKSGSDSGDEDQRQESADANAAWLGDARDAPEAEHDYISLETDTPVVILGDFNLIDDIQPDITIRTGDIQDTGTFGPAVKGDWDGSDLADAYPDDPWSDDHDTWPSDVSNPYRRFDRQYYTDSVVMVANSFILNTRNMTASQRSAAGVNQYDTEDASDHLPVIVDYRMAVRVTPTPVPLPVTPTPVNLLSNGGFEDWTGGSPDDWDLESPASASVAEASSPVHSGASSAALTTIGAPGYYGKGIYQSVYTVAPGDRFLFSVWVYSIEDSGMGISGNWWDGSSADYWSTVRAAGSGEWEKLELITGPAPSGVVNLRVMVRGFRESVLCGYADDASLELLAPVTPTPPPPSPTPSPAPNLLENGGFETWGNVRTLDGWSSESSCAAAQEFQEVFEGNYAMELSTTTSPGPYGKGYYQDIAVAEGESYTFSARTLSGTASAVGIVLSWWDGATSDFQTTVYNSGIAGWEKLSWSGTAPAGTVSARLYVRGFLDSDVCGYADSARFWTYEITPVPTPSVSPTPSPTTTPSPSPSPTPIPPTPPSGPAAVAGDYDGDGTSDVALFRPSSGLWLVRGLTKAWFGASSDEVVPSDY
ncbi:MAG TPA: hypothetical protein PLI51_10240, partial [bacterium]|nr:hypothetical protein [bacterium]